MTTAVFDTLMFAKKLKQAGVSEAQAEVHAEALHDILENSIATKHDIKLLKDDIKELRHDIEGIKERVVSRLTITLGSMMVAGFGVLAIIMKI